MKKKIVCFIPVRSKSKRLKNKNILKINGDPLIKFVCKKIIKSKLINEFYIGSDSNKIYNQIGKLKNKILFFRRSNKSSTSLAQSELAIKEFLYKKKDVDIVVFLQVTNPFVNFLDLDQAIKKLFKYKHDCILSVVKSKKFLWKNDKFISPINYNYRNRKMSQNLKNYYVENGSFYIFYKKNFLKYNNRLHKKIGLYEMKKESLFEIDDQEDLKIVRKLV